ACVPPAPARSLPCRRRAARHAPAAQPRGLRPRRARADPRHQTSGMDRYALRPVVGLCVAAPEARARAGALCPAARRVARRRAVWSLADARWAIERLIGSATDWSRLDEFLISYVVEPSQRATVFASSFAATLELVREGLVEVHQHAAFAPIYLRKRAADDAA